LLGTVRPFCTARGARTGVGPRGDQNAVRVVFAELDTDRAWSVASLGPAFIAAFLRREGHEAALVRVDCDWPLERAVQAIRDARPDLIGVSMTTRQWLRAREVIGAVRASGLDVPVVAGGLHATFAPEQVLSAPGFDYVCLGEGEAPALDLVRALERGGRAGVAASPIANIQVRGGPRPALRKPIEPLDAVPFMARDLLDERWGVVHVSTQRGCPFPCTYCAARMYDELYETAGGSYGRRRTHENVLDELFAIRAKGPLSYVIFLDDTFTIHHPWVKRFCAIYGERLRVPFSLHARVETVSPELLEMLAKAGCRHITYGVESGSERVRREVMRRPVSNQRFRDVFRWSRDLGIIATANYMLGLPGETRAEVEETLALHDLLKPDDFAYFVFYPFPGTRLFHECREKGLLPEDWQERPANHRESILRLKDLSPEDVAELYDRFTEARRRDLAARMDPASPEASKAQALAAVERCAASG